VAGLVGTYKANLNNSIQVESYEYETVYKIFAEEANKAEDTVAAKRFNEIRQKEANIETHSKQLLLHSKRRAQLRSISRLRGSSKVR
jgi:rubrerythrin